jgi:co-chaperonin GroES (HSP10)
MKNIAIDPNLIEPQGDYLLVEVVKAPSETDSGFELVNSESTSATPMIARVIKAGAKCVILSSEVVVFRRYALDEVKIPSAEGDKSVYLLQESEVIGKYPPVEIDNQSNKNDADEKAKGEQEGDQKGDA